MNLFGKSIGAWAKAIAVTTVVVMIGLTLVNRYLPEYGKRVRDGIFPWE